MAVVTQRTLRDAAIKTSVLAAQFNIIGVLLQGTVLLAEAKLPLKKQVLFLVESFIR